MATVPQLLPRRAPYLGQAATRCFPQTTTNAGTTRGMSRSKHTATDRLVNPTVIYGNFKLVSGVEAASLGAGTLKVALEYPAGVFTLANECIANGNAGVAFPAGLTTFTFAATVPKGAQFWMRPYEINANGVSWAQVAGGNNMFGNDPTDGMEIGSVDNDKTMGGSVGAANGICMFPLVIATMKRTPSVLINGDSRQAGGVAGITDASALLGTVARTVGPVYGYTSFAQSATWQTQWNAGSHTYLNTLIAAGYWTHLVNAYGVNDIGQGTAAATIAAARATWAAAVKALKSDMVIIGTTLPPYVTSSDVFLTKANQTIATNQTRTFTFNDLVRAGMSGEDYVWDEADGIDPFREGKYPISRDPSAASRTPGSCTAGTISGTTFTVAGTVTGGFNPGDYLYDAGGNVKDTTYIVEQLTGTPGLAGTYRLNRAYPGGYPGPAAVTATTITTAGTLTRDGLHVQYAGEEMIVRTKGPDLLAKIAA